MKYRQCPAQWCSPPPLSNPSYLRCHVALVFQPHGQQDRFRFLQCKKAFFVGQTPPTRMDQGLCHRAPQSVSRPGDNKQVRCKFPRRGYDRPGKIVRCHHLLAQSIIPQLACDCELPGHQIAPRPSMSGIFGLRNIPASSRCRPFSDTGC